MMRDERWNKKWDLFPLHSVDDPLNQCAPRHIHPIENRCSRHMFIITPWQVSHLRPAQIKTEGFKCVSVWWHPHKFWGLAKSKNFFLLFGHVGILGSSSFIQHYHEPVNWVLRLFSFFCPWGKINVNGSQFFFPHNLCVTVGELQVSLEESDVLMYLCKSTAKGVDCSVG